MPSTTLPQSLPASASGSFAVLLGRVGGQRFALPAAAVERILPMAEVTPLADAPSGVSGLLDLGGDVLAVVDPRLRLGLAAAPIHPEQHLVLTSAVTRYLLWVDRVEELVEVPGAAVDEVETLGPRQLVPRVIRLAGETLPVLSPESLDPGTIIRREAGA